MTAIDAEDYCDPQDAFDIARRGDTVTIDRDHALTDGAVYAVPGGVTVRIGNGVTLTQTVWGRPVFDLLDADAVTITGGRLVCSAERGDMTDLPPFRGETGYLYGAGVWANGSDLTLNVHASGFTCGVYLSAWDGRTLTAHHGKRNRVDAVVDDVDFGVQWCGQEDLNVDVQARNIAWTPGGGPPHALYGSGNQTVRSRRISIGRAVCADSPHSNAFQTKYADSVMVSHALATGCPALFNFIDVTDVTVTSGLLSAPAGDMVQVPVDFQRIDPTKNNGITVGQLRVQQQACQGRSFKQLIAVVGSDVHIGMLDLVTSIEGATGVPLVLLDGSDITVDSLRTTQRGYEAKPVMVGAKMSSEHVIVNGRALR